MNSIHPSAILVIGAVLAMLPRSVWRHALVLSAPLGALLSVLTLGHVGLQFQVGELFTMELLSPTVWNRPFAVLFCLVCFLGLLFARPLNSRLEDSSALFYAAAAVGAVMAGDLFTFYCWWEILALSATILIFGGGSAKSRRAAFRYLIYHVAGGLLLLFGLLTRLAAGFQPNITEIGLDSPGGWLIFLGLGVNCAWPLLHTWLTDAYPEGSVSGVIFLSAFTTKTAIYALVVFFPGTKALIAIGTVMAAFPIFYAVIENDLRRVLAYSLINQVGFMVVGIGIGTDLALNGAVCHAMTDLVFKGLLFMTVGACLYRTGYATATDLGGLFKKMPVSAVCCIVGAASISAFPGFSGFVSKSMITTAAASGKDPYTVVWLVLIFASAGVFHHAGIKIPFFAFFGHDSGHEVEEVPLSMQAAMIISALTCLAFGLAPNQTVYTLLPLPNDYAPYSPEHILAQTELLFFSALAFTLLLLAGVYPAEIRSKNLDFDYILAGVVRRIGEMLDKGLNGLNSFGDVIFLKWAPARAAHFFSHAPARISAWIARLWFTLKGEDQEKIDALEERFYQRFKKSALPVGASAIYAIILLGLLALL